MRINATTKHIKGEAMVSKLSSFPFQFILALATSIFFYHGNLPNLMSYIDGQYLLELNRSQIEFGAKSLGFNTNPLQGLSSLWSFANTSLMPDFYFSQFTQNENLRKLIIHIVGFVEVFLVVKYLFSWCGSLGFQSTYAAWLAVSIIMPLTFPAHIYNVILNNPQITFMIIYPLILIPFIHNLGTRSIILSFLDCMVLFLAAWYMFLVLGFFTSLSYPFLVIVLSVSFFYIFKDKKKLISKLIWLGILTVLLFASGYVFELYGMTMDTAFRFFPDMLMRQERFLADGSVLFRSTEPYAQKLAMLALLGACLEIKLGGEKIKLIASSFVIFTILIIIATLIYAYSGWSAAIPIYFEWVLWPIYPIFATSLAVRSYRYFQKILPLNEVNFIKHLMNYKWMTGVLTLFIFHGSHHYLGQLYERPNVFPPKETEITEFLIHNIGIGNGKEKEFNGRVATLTGNWLAEDALWYQSFDKVDMPLIRFIGNEHRDIGLWYYNIPTLFQFSHMISPRFFLITNNYLSYETSRQIANIMNIRKFNKKILSMLGIRFVITDSSKVEINTKRILEINTGDYKYPLSLDELNDPLIISSPTHVIRYNLESEALRLVGSDGFDFHTQVVTNENFEANLVAAKDMHIKINSSAYEVTAKSEGFSLLILPIEYSNCLRVSDYDSEIKPKVFRANYLLTGIYFKSKIKANIELNLGPFNNMTCKVKDFIDDKTLNQ